TRRRIYDDADAPPNLEKLGAEVILGSARFCDPRTIEVQKSSGISIRLTTRSFIIATGSRPKTPNFAESTLTNETIFELESQPKHLLIIGAGPVGVEMAQAFRRLGSEVTIVVRGNRILTRDDPEQTRQLQEYL